MFKSVERALYAFYKPFRNIHLIRNTKDFFKPGFLRFKQRLREKRARVPYYRWRLSQFATRVKLAVRRPWRGKSVAEELKRSFERMNPEALITIGMGSRCLGNIDFKIHRFLDSVIANTKVSQRIEILIKIDDDDDIFEFERVLKKYGEKLHIRFLLGPRGGGYFGLQWAYHEQFVNRSPSSLLFFIVSEDSLISYPAWDDNLLEIQRRMEDEGRPCFVGSSNSFERTMSIGGPFPMYPEPVYWIEGTNYPIFSNRLLDVLLEVTSKHEDWSLFGNLQNVDSFAGDMVKQAWLNERESLYVKTPEYAERHSTFVWIENEERREGRSRNLIKFWRPEYQTVRDELAEAIVLYNRKARQSSAARPQKAFHITD